MKRNSFAALLFAGAMTLGTCAFDGSAAVLASAGDTSASAKETGSVSITTTESWDFSPGFYPALSPADSSTYGFTYYARNCYDTLVVREGDEFRAGLAETWDISDDGLTYTYFICGKA